MKFCYLRDRIKLDSVYPWPLHCFHCKEKTHLLAKCPHLHYCGDKDFLIKRLLNWRPQERTAFQRKKKIVKFNSRYNFVKIQQSSNDFQKQAYSNENLFLIKENNEDFPLYPHQSLSRPSSVKIIDLELKKENINEENEENKNEVSSEIENEDEYELEKRPSMTNLNIYHQKKLRGNSSIRRITNSDFSIISSDSPSKKEFIDYEFEEPHDFPKYYSNKKLGKLFKGNRIGNAKQTKTTGFNQLNTGGIIKNFQ